MGGFGAVREVMEACETPACTRGRAATEGCATAPAGAGGSGMSTFGIVSTAGKKRPKIACRSRYRVSVSVERTQPRAPSDATRRDRPPSRACLRWRTGRPRASVSPRPSRNPYLPSASGRGDNPHPTGRFGFPTQAMLAAVQARGARGGGVAASSPPPEFAGVFKPRIKPDFPWTTSS